MKNFCRVSCIMAVGAFVMAGATESSVGFAEESVSKPVAEKKSVHQKKYSKISRKRDGSGREEVKIQLEFDGDDIQATGLTAEELIDVVRNREKYGSKGAGVLVPLFFFLSLVLVAGGILLYRSRIRADHQKTLRLMIEKGAEIPEGMLALPEAQTKKPGSDLRRGTLFASLGLGFVLFCFFGTDDFRNGWSFGLIPLFVGLGLIGISFAEKKKLSNG